MMTTPIPFSPAYIALLVAVLLLPGGLLLSPLLMRRKPDANKDRPSRQDGAIRFGDGTPARRPNARIRAISAPLARAAR